MRHTTFPPSLSPAHLRSLIAVPVLLATITSLFFSLCFLILGYEVTRTDTRTIDDHILRSVTTHTASWPLALPKDITLLGSSLVIANVTALLGIWFLWRRRWFDALFLAIAIGGSAGLAFVLKHLIARPRPTAFFRVPEGGYGFPSGHTMSITTLALASAFLLWRSGLHIAVKVVSSLLLASGIAAVGVSRLVLGVHYPTDVLGSVLLGAAWLTALVALRCGIERMERDSIRIQRGR